MSGALVFIGISQVKAEATFFLGERIDVFARNVLLDFLSRLAESHSHLGMLDGEFVMLTRFKRVGTCFCSSGTDRIGQRFFCGIHENVGVLGRSILRLRILLRYFRTLIGEVSIDFRTLFALVAVNRSLRGRVLNQVGD